MINPRAADAYRSPNLPDLKSEIEFHLIDLMNSTQSDFPALFKLIPQIALLTETEYLSLKQRFVHKWPKTFPKADFDKAIRAERRGMRDTAAGINRSALPIIKTNNRPMREVVADSLDALRAANEPPSLFVRSGVMVYIGIDERERPSMIEINKYTKAHLRGRLDRAANYYRAGENTDVAMPPPVEVVDDILALPSSQWGLPALEVIVEVPTLRIDGTVLDQPGYDATSRMLYMPAPGLKMDPIPAEILADDIEAAIALIDEAIGEFPYAEDGASKANVLGLLLTAIARPAISSCIPLALIDAPQAGTGKSLLVDVLAMIWSGREAPMMPFPRQEEEVQKSITATLLQGRTLVCFDNIEGTLSSPALALVLTAHVYESRILGVSQNMVAPNRATWVATGNNIKPSGDLPRRCYHIRLDAKSSRPFQGREFKRADILGWVRENRGPLLRALLIIAVNWYRRGRPVAVTDPLGKFESWHRTIGGILKTSGIDGFLSNLAVDLQADEVARQWESLFAELIEEFPKGQEFFSSDISDRNRNYYLTPIDKRGLLPRPYTLPDSLADVDHRKELTLERALGRSLAKRLDMRFGDRELRITREWDSHKKVWRWKVLEGKEVNPAS